MRVDVARLFAEHELAYERRMRERAEREPRQRAIALELAVLNAMITRYEPELFTDVEVCDFADWRSQRVWSAIRNLEATGRVVDGEILPIDIALLLEREDRERAAAMTFGETHDRRPPPIDAALRDALERALAMRIVTAELAPPGWNYLAVIVEPPAWVEAPRTPAEIQAAVARLQAASLERMARREFIWTHTPGEP